MNIDLRIKRIQAKAMLKKRGWGLLLPKLEREPKAILSPGLIYNKFEASASLRKSTPIFKKYEKKHYILTKEDNRKDNGSRLLDF